MKKILFIIFALIIALPALAMDVDITVLDENNEPAVGATIIVDGTNNVVAVGTNDQPDTNIKLSNVPDYAQIKISFMGYETQTLPAQPTMSVKMKPSTTSLPEVVVSANCPEIPARGIKEQKYDSEEKKCYPTACYEPCYKLKDKKCELQKTDGGVFSVLDKKCILTCLPISGYVKDPKDQWKCTQDCTSLIKDPNVKKAQFKGSVYLQNLKCEITECKGKYHASGDKQSCIPDQGDCTDEQLAAIHASEGYLITQQNKCVPKKCLESEYKKEGDGDNATCVHQVGKPCNVKHATNAKYEMRDRKLVCVVVKCDETQGYKVSKDGLSCSKDCLAEIEASEPLATKAEYDSKMDCKIQKCEKKDSKKYIPSDDGKRCEETERDCNKETDKTIWPEHATAAGYKKSKTGGTAKCVATECEDGYELSGGKCVSVNDSDCDKKPENSKKSHRYYDDSTQQTLCLIDECKDGYKVSNDLLSCILESALSEEDAQKRMDQLKENAKAMKDRENSIENKLLGAAGIGAVGIGGMNIASALSEQSADRNAEEDMKAYLATFRCDYGQGRNITGGETNIQLPGGNELIQYTTEYKQLATSLKSDKEALGMMPGIESETVFDSATTGLYDDVSIGIQKGAFTSLSRALLDENSADATEWQKMKDDTAKKLKTGIIVAGAGAVATIAGNIAINHGKGDKSDDILNDWEPKKQKIPDITLPRIPCSEISGTTGTGYVPNCECPGNAYFAENERKCIPCGTNERVNDAKNACVCQDGYHRADNNNCVADVVPPKCSDFGTTGEYPNCKCSDSNATFNKESLKCECNDRYSNPNGGKCLRTCEGLNDVDTDKAPQENVPNCSCEYSGATFDPTRNGCYCPQGQQQSIENDQKKCVTPPTPGTPCNKIAGATGTMIPDGCTCTDNNKEFKKENGNYICKCKPGLTEDTSGNCVNGTDPVFQGSFQASQLFATSVSVIEDTRCKAIIEAIKNDQQYATNKNYTGNLCVISTGHTDTKWFSSPDNTEERSRQKNIELSQKRANAMQRCISTYWKELFTNANPTYKAVGKGWSECKPYKKNTSTDECRKVTVQIYHGNCDTVIKAFGIM